MRTNRPVSWIAAVILCVLLACVDGNAFAAFWNTKSHRSNDAFAGKKSTYVVMPELVVGNVYFPKDAYAGTGAMLFKESIAEAVAHTFRIKGYRAARTSTPGLDNSKSAEYDRQAELAWNNVLEYMDAGMFSKIKNAPFQLSEKNLGFLKSAGTDTVTFVKAYGYFNEQHVSGETKTAVAGVSAAVQIALTGSAAVFGENLQKIDLKIAIFEVETGNLIWYEEGYDHRTDAKSIGMLADTLRDALSYLPENKIKEEKVFRKRRSQIIS